MSWFQMMKFSLVFCFSSIASSVISAKPRTTGKNNEPSNKDEYGITWMYFPDGDDIPRPISLEMPPRDLLLRSFWMDGIEYRLYTRHNKNNYVILDDAAAPINDSYMSIIQSLQKAPVKIITHGWESSADKSAVINIKDAYLEMEKDINIIGVDWGRIADSVLYPIVAMQTAMVGLSVGRFIDALIDSYGIPASQIHLIGHSLGAHVMGNAGAATKVPIQRITGLDPARPLFEVPSIPNTMKLDTSDALFVDVIHTCGGILGVQNPIGHVDFFPNSGAAPQPGCGEINHVFEACSHSRSHYFFAESIRNPKSFPAYACANWTDFMNNGCSVSNTYLGEYVNPRAIGTFYLITNSKIPYGRGF